MSDAIEVSGLIPTSPDEIFDAWIDGDQHGDMTGGEATSDPRPGGSFTAWDGYIEGRHVELEPNRRILQAWRSSEFPEGSPDSRLEILLEEVPEGTRITIRHSEIPDGQGPSYAQGWEDHYFAPMREYFSDQG